MTIEEREDTTGRFQMELRATLDGLGHELREWVRPIVDAIEAHGKVVLAVDDEPGIRAIYRKTLSRHVKLWLAESVLDVRGLCETVDHIDVLVLDMRLQDGTGVDVSAIARSRWGTQFHTIILSGYEVEDLQERAIRSHGGTVEIHQKPAVNIAQRIIDVAQAGPARLHMTPARGVRKP